MATDSIEALRDAPSACDRPNTGIVTVVVNAGSSPRGAGKGSAWLLAMRIATAPAAWTLSAFCLNEQLPRSTRATLAVTSLVIAAQASVVVPASATTTGVLVTSNDCGPKAAMVTSTVEPGGVTVSEKTSPPLHT